MILHVRAAAETGWLGWAGLAGWLALFPIPPRAQRLGGRKEGGTETVLHPVEEAFLPLLLLSNTPCPVSRGLLVMECMARMRCDGGGGRGYL